MTREIGTTFQSDGRTYEVVEDVEHLNRRTRCDVTIPCAFRGVGVYYCNGLLKDTGDCKAFYRTDKKSVYFKKIN